MGRAGASDQVLRHAARRRVPSPNGGVAFRPAIIAAPEAETALRRVTLSLSDTSENHTFALVRNATVEKE